MSLDTQNPPLKQRKFRAQKPRDVDLDNVQARLFTVLLRESEQLMELSYRKKLDPGAAKDLINYLKLMKEMRDLEADALDNLSNEELEELINKKTKKGEET